MFRTEDSKRTLVKYHEIEIYHLSKNFRVFIHRGINSGIGHLRLAGVFCLAATASTRRSLLTVFFTTVTPMVAVAVCLSASHHLLPC
jgi:hypothetical protein